jgi:hypothetical protein
MENKFVALYNSIASSRYTTANKILKQRSANAKIKDRSDMYINTTFNILAVSEGCRAVGLFSIPKNWKMPSGLNLHFMTWGTAGLFANSDLIGEEKFTELGTKYNGNDPKWNVEMGRQLGYIQPSAVEDIDAVVCMMLKLPNTPYDAKLDRMYTIVSEYGPQSIKVTSTKNLNKILRSMQEKWSALAKQVHPEFEIYVRLEFFDTVSKK